MTKQTTHRKTHTRAVLLAAVAVTNVVSFVVGVSAAGHIAIKRSSTPVAVQSPSPTASARATAARATARAKTVARPKAKAAHPVAAAATAGVRAGQTVQATPIPITGKGMWIYEFDKAARGNPLWIVIQAKRRGLTHLYVRAGSSVAGLSGWRNIARILPVAHRAGLKVIAWDFPYLRDPGADVRRARWILRQNVHGHQVDGFAADVETRAEGTNLTRFGARRYATWLRIVARDKFIILVPPRPNRFTTSFYPYDILVPKFDAVAPMVYWGRQPPAEATAWAVAYLSKFGKPVAPIGQAYDMGPEGGPKGHPKGRALVRFMDAARSSGAVGVSFWSWQHTPKGLWHTIDTYRWPARTGRS